jgi:nitrite reductase/ring-hydroxylating ferredoxin subunit
VTASAPPKGYLCRLAEIPDGGGKGFWFGADSSRHGIFVLRRGDALLAYVNSCPHRGTPLDWQPDRFLDASGRFILCATHGALFRLDDGYCVGGPCAGAHLAAVAVVCRGEHVYLASEGDPADAQGGARFLP